MNAAVCVFVFNRNISGCNVIDNVNAEASRRRNSLDWMLAFRSHFLRCGFGYFFSCKEFSFFRQYCASFKEAESSGTKSLSH